MFFFLRILRGKKSYQDLDLESLSEMTEEDVEADA